MYLSFQNKSFWENLHLKYGLEDWDMAEELKLTITDEEFLPAPDETPCRPTLKWQPDPSAHGCSLPGALPDARGRFSFSLEPGIQSHLWMWVNPSLVCPIAGSPGVDPAGSDNRVASGAGDTEASSPNASWDYSDPDCSEEDVLSSSCSEVGKNKAAYPCPSFRPGLIYPHPFSPSSLQLTEDEDASRVDTPVPREMTETPKLNAMPMPGKSTVLKPQRVKLKYPRQRSTKIEGGWPRPPLNYCVLITLALCNSTSGSLTVQQIYQFTRQHFPFFRTAPEGWKNTIRHNLCFSSCFEKATGFACSEGNRRSCLWRLTPEGRRKFQEEAQALPKEALDLVRQSMSEPGTFQRAGAPQNAEQVRFHTIPVAGGIWIS
ncbi:forkhead box protein R1 [Egretta garzetta]|uniref:forkhead box protein R1 n=1 Tax=Egretta garzetta TaxID=188379 RepID=UPI00163C2B67|nr:forkhead box protein R1 [Egretta garzetta]